MKREDKIQEILDEDRIFLVSETNRYAYYICKGVSNQVYDVVYNKGQDKWSCKCDNVRLTPCYHIEATKIFREKSELEKTKISN